MITNSTGDMNGFTVAPSMMTPAYAGATAAAIPLGGAAMSPPSYDAIALNPNGPRSRTNLFVRKLASAVVEQDLKALFVPFGEILSFALMRDIHTGESLGTAFVRFATHEQAKAAMAALDDTPLYGRPISIQWAKRQHDSTPIGEARSKIHKLFVRNIPLDVSTRRLRQVFSQYGSISNVTLHPDTSPPSATSSHSTSGQYDERASSPLGVPPGSHESGHSADTHPSAGSGGGGGAATHDSVRNIAFVVFHEDGAASAAVEALHNTSPFPSCDGVPLMVKLAEDNRQRLERRQRFQDADVSAPLLGGPKMVPDVRPMAYMPGSVLLPTSSTPQALLPNGQSMQPLTGSPLPANSACATTATAASATVFNPALGNGNGGSYVLLSTPGGGAPQPYWLQPVPSHASAATATATAAGAPSNASPVSVRASPSGTGTPPMMYALSPGQSMTPPSLTPSSAPMPTSGFVLAGPATGPYANLPMGLTSAFGTLPYGAVPSYGAVPLQVTQHHDAAVRSLPLPQSSQPQLPQVYTHPQMATISHGGSVSNYSPTPVNRSAAQVGSVPMRSPNSPVRAATAPGQFAPSVQNSRAGLSMSYTQMRESLDRGLFGSTVNSAPFTVRASPVTSASPLVSGLVKPNPAASFAAGRSADFAANGMSLSSLQPRRPADAWVDPDATFTDQDTTYSSVRLDNSANLIGGNLLDGPAKDEHELDSDYNLAGVDMSEVQLLELARNMALLEDI